MSLVAFCWIYTCMSIFTWIFLLWREFLVVIGCILEEQSFCACKDSLRFVMTTHMSLIRHKGSGSGESSGGEESDDHQQQQQLATQPLLPPPNKSGLQKKGFQLKNKSGREGVVAVRPPVVPPPSSQNSPLNPSSLMNRGMHISSPRPPYQLTPDSDITSPLCKSSV